MLRSVFSLPSIRTLKTDMQALNITVGFNDCAIKALKEKVSTMSEKDKIVAIIFDEMSMKESVSYNIELDCVEGFENFGT